jgi:hypothetical protein
VKAGAPWEVKQYELAIGRARKQFGPVGWRMLGTDLRTALIKAEVLAVIAAGASFENTPQGRLADLAMRFDGEQE